MDRYSGTRRSTCTGATSRHPRSTCPSGKSCVSPKLKLMRQPERVAATLDQDRTPRHVYTVHLHLSDDINRRGIDLLTPAWHRLDLTTPGRGEWYAGLDY